MWRMSCSKLKIITITIIFNYYKRVSDPWFSQMKSKIHPIERYALETTQEDLFWNSKLACSIKLKPWMNELIVSHVRQIDPRTHLYNHYKGIGEAGDRNIDEERGEF